MPETPKQRFPWTAVPAARSSANMLRVRLWLVLGTLIAAALLGPLSFVLAAGRSSGGTAAATSSVTTDTAFAAEVARRYLAADTEGIPVAKDVDESLGIGDRGPNVAPPAMEVVSIAPMGTKYDFLVDAAGNQTTEYVATTRFLVTARTAPTAPDQTAASSTSTSTAPPAPELFELTVVTTRTAAGRPAVAAIPSLLPWRPAGNGQAPAVPTGDEASVEALVPAPVKARIDEWAAAFAEADTDAFRGITGGDPSNYQGLGGFIAESVQPVSAAVSPDGRAVIVRVRLVLAPSGANGFSAASEYDLLITQAATQDPKVVAWGPPGSARTLTDPNQPTG